MTSCIVGKKIFYSHTFMHYKCDMKIDASRFIRVISLCHLVVCYHSWPWPGVLVSTCSLHGLVYISTISKYDVTFPASEQVLIDSCCDHMMQKHAFGHMPTDSAMSDQGLCCLRTESLDTKECSNGEQMPGRDFAHE